jgi:hypothetical protein
LENRFGTITTKASRLNAVVKERIGKRLDLSEAKAQRPKCSPIPDIDESASGKLFYRLKQLDFDGAFQYSPVIEVESDCT